MKTVLTLAQNGLEDAAQLLRRYGLTLECIPAGAQIAGSYWGESEAGLVGNRLYARADTPLHSILHEASHYVCMTPQRRTGLHTNAGGDDLEECGVCYLQILLADSLPDFGRERMLADMGQLGLQLQAGIGAQLVQQDAQDAHDWLLREGLIDQNARPTWRLRK